MAFLLRPKFQAGESLSSWRQRSGLANGFRRFPTFNGRWAARDLDLLPSGAEIDWLAREFNVSAADLLSASLDQFAENLSSDISCGPLARWVLPCARQSSRNGATSGYCPICLDEDQRPFFRLSWRLAFVTHCSAHECRLMEHCPNCSHCIWPSALAERASGVQKWIELALCLRCGHPLSRVEPIFDGRQETSLALWRALTTGALPLNAPPGATLKDYFTVLWSMSRFVRRNMDKLRKSLPLIDLSDLDPDALHRTVIERLTSGPRQTILSTAMWLLEEWPARMIEVCRTAGVSGQNFGCTEIQNPKWFDDVIREHLFQRANWVTREHVQTAIAELAAEDLPVSKNALRRKLGITESWAINELLAQRRTASIDELANMCRQYYVTFAHTPTSRDQQRTLTRDFLILLLSAFSGKSIEAVCSMERPDTEAIVRASHAMIGGETAPDMRFLVACLEELDDQYRHGIRPEFQFRAQDVPQSWFISRFGKKMDGHSVRSRITRVMKSSVDPKLWSSADSFRTTLFPSNVLQR